MQNNCSKEILLAYGVLVPTVTANTLNKKALDNTVYSIKILQDKCAIPNNKPKQAKPPVLGAFNNDFNDDFDY